MLTGYRRLAVLATAAGFSGCSSATPPPAAVILGPPTDTVRTSYTGVTRAVWLGGERWAVVALTDRLITLVDFGTDSVRRLGGDSASTPRHPTTAFRVGDTIYVSDWGRRQVSLWTLDGKWVRAVPAGATIGGALPQARDDSGRFYAELAPPARPGGDGQQDSGAAVRTGATLEPADTVARLSPLDVAAVVRDGGRRFERRVFSGTDRWGALADGSVWVARVYKNRVDWRSPEGTWREGQSLPDRVLEVTRYDRELFVRNFPKELRSMAQQLPFAPVKPPFNDAFGASDGTVWLVKSRAPTDSAGRYHVVGRDGRLLRDLRVPGTGRVIGATGDAAVVAESTRQGVRLLRFALPPVPREVAHDS